jgi:hypothetical protein
MLSLSVELSNPFVLQDATNDIFVSYIAMSAVGRVSLTCSCCIRIFPNTWQNVTLPTWAQFWEARLCLPQARTKWGVIEE